MSKIVEEWRPVVGYEGLYEVSDWGNVRSVDRTFEYYHPSAGKKIKRTFKGQLLRKVLNSYGYHIVSLHKDGKQREGKVHRLVADAFLQNPENKPAVGHLKTLDNGLEDKTANEAWNLAWMTTKENLNYGTIGERLSERVKGDSNPMKRPEVAAKMAESRREVSRRLWREHPEYFENFKKSDKHNEKKKIKVNQYNNDTGEFIKTWDSAADVEEELGICHSNITACCKGKVNSVGGFKWEYANE